MPLPLAPITLVPGQSQPIQLQNLGSIQAIKLSNGSPFNVTYSGFGRQGSDILVAGTEDILYADVNNSGSLTLYPSNDYGVSGNGIANITIYFAGESLPSDKGHYPVTIPVQTVQAKVAAVQTLSNEGQAAGTLVIDYGPSGNNQVGAFYNDHFILSVVQAGVAHQVLKGQTSGNPLQIGQAGDISEVLGKLTVDQLLTASLGLTQTGVLSSTGGAQTITGNAAGSLHLGQSATGDTLDTNATDTFLKSGSLVHIQSPSGTDVATFAATGLVTALLGLLNLTGQAPTSVSGSVGGTAKFYVPIWGAGLKILIVALNGWNSASVATFTFPTAGGGLQFGWSFASYGTAVANTWGLFIGGTAQPIRHMLTLGAAGAAGTDEAITALKSDNIGAFALTGGAATSIQIGTTGGAANSGTILLIGV